MVKSQETRKDQSVEDMHKKKDQTETFSPVARMEGVRTLLAYAAYKGFKVYQMDVKSRFLNGILEEKHGIFVTNQSILERYSKVLDQKTPNLSAHQWQQDTSYPKMMNQLKSTKQCIDP